MNYMDSRLPERFWGRTMPCPMSGCWIWTGWSNGQDYGKIRCDDGKIRASHRVAYEASRGPIPEGLEIDHLCRNTRCCNPQHLEAVTHRENIIRGDAPRVLGQMSKARGAAQTHCKNGHELAGDNLVGDTPWRKCKTCTLARNRRWWSENRAVRK